MTCASPMPADGPGAGGGSLRTTFWFVTGVSLRQRRALRPAAISKLDITAQYGRLPTRRLMLSASCCLDRVIGDKKAQNADRGDPNTADRAAGHDVIGSRGSHDLDTHRHRRTAACGAHAAGEARRSREARSITSLFLARPPRIRNRSGRVNRRQTAGMFKAGQIDIDVIDTGDDVLLQLEQAGALEPLPYKDFKYTDPDDIDPGVRLTYQVGSFVYAFVLGFNTTVYPVGKEPKNWAEFWDIKAFPGTRTLADIASGAPNLEIALIADGVAMDKVYPIDIERAFKSLTRIKPAVPKFWDTGALAAQMLADKEAAMGVIWSTRVQVAADGGAPGRCADGAEDAERHGAELTA